MASLVDIYADVVGLLCVLGATILFLGVPALLIGAVVYVLAEPLALVTSGEDLFVVPMCQATPSFTR